MSRQDRLNWQIRLCEGDMTPSQLAAFASLFQHIDLRADDRWRADWVGQLDNVTLISDGFLPFRDNVDHASRIGTRHIVEPGGSIRTEEIADACAELGIDLIHTGLRLFHH